MTAESGTSQIAWQEWGPEAFARAQAENKPILLSISAVWCHWCHVMDGTTYDNPEVAASIKERYVPVRVDTDLRPDINERYNQGGWPTTVFLTPAGHILHGATYLPPEQMQGILAELSDYYHNNRGTRSNSECRPRSRRMRRAQRAGRDGAPAECGRHRAGTDGAAVRRAGTAVSASARSSRIRRRSISVIASFWETRDPSGRR